MTPPRSLIALVFAAALAGPGLAADTYKTDPGHTEVRFSWSHAGVTTQHGEFDRAEGTLVLDPEKVEAATLNATIDATSVSVGFPPLDDHIKSADFLEVETYPTITFESTSVTATGDNTADITGNLTLHGVTRPLTLQATMTHLGEHPLGQFIDYNKGSWAAFTATGEIDPADYGVGMTIPVGKLMIEIVSELKVQG